MLNSPLETMLDDHGFEIYEENQYPIAYLLTFRTYGTWLHGDQRGSYTRDGGKLGVKFLNPNVPLQENMAESIQKPTLLSERQRKVISDAIAEICQYRNYLLRAVNLRSNHVHSVVSKAVKPERIVNDFKAYATRALRRGLLAGADERIWSRGASTRYLCKPKHVLAVVDYVLYAQEDLPFELPD